MSAPIRVIVPLGPNVVYSREAYYGTRFDASWMKKSVAKEIIMDCAEEWLRESGIK